MTYIRGAVWGAAPPDSPSAPPHYRGEPPEIWEFWLPPVIPPITGGSTLNFENFGSPRTPPGLGFDPPHYRGEQPGGVTPPGHFLLPPVPGGAWAGSPPLPGGPGSPTLEDLKDEKAMILENQYSWG